MTTVQARAESRLRPATVEPSRPGALLPGALAVALLLFGTRWGSYLGVGGVILLSDVLMAGAVVLAVLRSARGRSALLPGTVRTAVPWPVLLLGLFAVAQLAFRGDYTFVAIRDAAPYIYVLLGLVGFYAARRATQAQRDRTTRVFVVALAAHAVWYAAVVALPDLPTSLPLLNATQEIFVFTPRPDVDCAIVGVLAAYVLWRALRHRRRVPLLLLVYVACWVPIVLSTSRAGLLGAATASAFVLLLVLTDGRRPPLNRIAVAFTVVVCAVVGIGLVLSSDVGTKFIATFDPDAADTSATGTVAEGTTRARSNAWNQVVDWTFQDTARTAVGVGFGTDFLLDSGARPLLVGRALEEDVTPRSPHNYWVGSLARLGVIGLALLAAAIALALQRIWRSRVLEREDGFSLLTASIVLALLLPATLGVVLESPFGAMPFWWNLGCVLGLATTAASRPSSRPSAHR